MYIKTIHDSKKGEIMKYDFKKIEAYWQKRWEEEKVFKAEDDSDKKKFYGLVEFPYPSGAGMHVGHIKAYVGLEAESRMKRMKGYNVLFPIGYDAFGLPAENYAIKTNTHPRIVTDQNIAHFTKQMKKVGFSFDWDRVIDTTDENYYKWTQWIFLKMFEHGLVFRDNTLVNYCPSCRVVLSNEDSQGGKCDICGNDIIQKEKPVWFLRITKYADKLLKGLEDVDYPENIKAQQSHWIGRSEGAFIKFSIDGFDEKIKVYTTRPDTLFGATFLVIAPEHPIVDKFADTITNINEVNAYKAECEKKSAFERTELNKDKSGVKLQGIHAINPVNGKKLPIFIADYVMMGYGTGAIMAVPAHDQRDFDFAKKHGIEIRQVILGGDIAKEAYAGDGEMIHSEFLNGYTNKKDSIKRMIEELEKNGVGEKAVQYKMQEWAFNRQRYWGEPIPIVHCDYCGTVPVPYSELPLCLPEVEQFMPGEDGESPLAKLSDFVNCKCPKCGRDAKRETDTMPQWAGSSWYYLRYTDPHNDDCFADPKKLDYWMPVDWYNGGMEHVTRHLIYSRFWHHFLYDIGLVNTPEPYAKRSAQGLILGPDSTKMSKSKGNVVDPLDIVDQYGADTLRVYVLFMGDYGASIPWNDNSLKGCKRFLDRVVKLGDKVVEEPVKVLEAKLHHTIKKVGDDIESMKYNTAVACLMTFINDADEAGKIGQEQYLAFVKLIVPFAPHVCEEIWSQMGQNGFISLADWPEYDNDKLVVDSIDMAVQVNGKVKSVIALPTNCSEEEAIHWAKSDEKIASALSGKNIVKIIYREQRILNFVVK